eukprot:scaffold2188_cov253-Pinguiococcus_pyrenoidosus.AAC.5
MDLVALEPLDRRLSLDGVGGDSAGPNPSTGPNHTNTERNGQSECTLFLSLRLCLRHKKNFLCPPVKLSVCVCVAEMPPSGPKTPVRPRLLPPASYPIVLCPS